MHDIRPQPPNAAAVIAAFPRESAEEYQAREYPTWPTGETRDIVRTQELLPGG
jgi:hypothetical protein